MFKNIKNFIVLLIAYLGLFSCGHDYKREDAKKYLPGFYSYKIPSGELQTLEIDTNFIFKQVVYSKNKDILYENSGKMNVVGEGIKIEHWLECYELGSQEMLLKPYFTNISSGVFWRRKEDSENILIIIFDETNYIFKKN